MTDQPSPDAADPGAAGDDADEDAIAQLLLASAAADAALDQPDMGTQPTTPDMGAATMSDPATNPNPQQPPAQPAAPPPTPPQPPAQPAAPQPGQPAEDGNTGDDGDRGFPSNTPVSQMTTDQQRNYYRYQARKHENRLKALGDVDALRQKAEQYDGLVAASQTEQERAVAAARDEGRQAAMREVGGRLVEAELRVAVGGRLDGDAFRAFVDNLDRSRFIDAAGNVDTDKVTSYVNTLFPGQPAASAPPGGPGTPAGTQPAQPAAPPRGPDFGQGARAGAPPNALEAGRAAARARHPKPQVPTPAGA